VSKVEQALGRFGAADAIIVAVSGGPDSVALLRALLHAHGGYRLIGAHVNHQLRGAESDADEAFVLDLCMKLSVECRCRRVDVRAAAQGANLEGTARQLRYDWLTRLALESGAHRVATGHTADDQAETVLHRLLRGAGLRGLRGIAPSRELIAGVTLVRPLLKVTRAEVMSFLADLRQDYRQDSSNLDLALTRNRIRHSLLPLLAADYNPEIAVHLVRLAEQAEEAYAVEAALAHAAREAAELARAGSLLVFDTRPLGSLARGRLREMFRLVWEREGWPMGAMDFDAWDRVAGVALGEAVAAEFAGGVQVRRRGRVVQVGQVSS
jgi:tRNA(Ile)-lysidine synthase